MRPAAAALSAFEAQEIQGEQLSSSPSLGKRTSDFGQLVHKQHRLGDAFEDMDGLVNGVRKDSGSI